MKEENQTIIKAINMFGRVPEQYELLEEIERLNNIINKKEQFLGDNIKRLEREVVKRDNIINELNTAYCKVITKCEEMIDSRFYMNDIAIKKYSDEIKDICKYYVGEAKELKGDDKSDKS